MKRRRLARLACAGLLLGCAGGIGAGLPLAATGAAPSAAAALLPSSRQPLRDPQFGVRTRQFGLQRQVQMYQWRRDGDGFTSDWISRAVDSSGFPPGFVNPGAMPYAVRYWIAEDVRVDGHPMDAEVVQAVGIWRDFRPSFNRLPGAITANFQPEGDGLGTAENPQLPRIGDVRVSWRELVLPPLQGRVELRDGRWRLPDPSAPPAEDMAAPEPERVTAEPAPPVATAAASDIDRSIRSMWWWNIARLVFALGVIVLLLRAALARRR